MANPSPEALSAQPAGADAPQIAVEPLLTTHRLLEACPGHPKGLELLHGDLFDSRLPVALSALAAVRALADTRSFPYVARLLGSANEEVQCAAVRALGSIRHPDAPKLLLDLLKTTRSEKLRREILAALGEAAPQDKEIAGIIRHAARTPMGSAGSRAHAAGLLLRIGGELALEELLADAREEVLDQILSSAAEDPGRSPRGRSRTAPRCTRGFPRAAARRSSPSPRGSSSPNPAGLLCESLADPHAEVRRAAYAALGTEPHHAAWSPAVIAKMSASVESNPALEDEAHAGDRPHGEAPRRGHGGHAGGARRAFMSRIAELFRGISAEGRKVSSDTHELGWLITRSKEYLEYYCDDDLKAALLRWLKGASTDTADGLLKQLKATAVRVEVRHFDGYSAVADLIKNPKRNGIALVARELSLAKTGKSRQFWQLIRIHPPGRRVPHARLVRGRPADVQGHLHVGAAGKALPPGRGRALRAGEGRHPRRRGRVQGMPDASPGKQGPGHRIAAPAARAARRAPRARGDPTSRLPGRSLRDPECPGGDLRGAAVIQRRAGEGAPHAALHLPAPARCGRQSPPISGTRSASTSPKASRSPPSRVTRRCAPRPFPSLERRITAGTVANRDGTIEFLYRVLRGSHEPSRRSAALMLWKMGDDYAPEVLRDFLATGAEEGTLEILRRLQGSLREPLVTALAPLFSRESSRCTGRFATCSFRRRTIPCAPGAWSSRCSSRVGAEDEDGGLLDESTPAVEVRTERSTFQFERENMQELVMFFSDIVGYSKKAQFLAPMQLSALIQEYEKILLTHVEAHEGSS